MQPINSGRIFQQVPLEAFVRHRSDARFQTYSRIYNSARNRELLQVQTKREQLAPLHTEGKRSNLEMFQLPAFYLPSTALVSAAVSLGAMNNSAISTIRMKQF